MPSPSYSTSLCSSLRTYNANANLFILLLLGLLILPFLSPLSLTRVEARRQTPPFSLSNRTAFYASINSHNDNNLLNEASSFDSDFALAGFRRDSDLHLVQFSNRKQRQRNDHDHDAPGLSDWIWRREEIDKDKRTVVTVLEGEYVPSWVSGYV